MSDLPCCKLCGGGLINSVHDRARHITNDCRLSDLVMSNEQWRALMGGAEPVGKPVAFGITYNKETNFISSLAFNRRIAQDQVDATGGHIVPLYTAPPADVLRDAELEFYIDSALQEHTITSTVTMHCKETGRVIAVFYNDYDAEAVIAAMGK